MLCLLVAGCAGSKDGVAPSSPVPAAEVPASPNPAGSWEFELNFSEKISTSNGWDVVLDTSDVTGYVSLANGWKVEVSND